MHIESLAEMRAEIAMEARLKLGDPAYPYIDVWLNREMLRMAKRYDFQQLVKFWYVGLTTTAPTPQTWTPYLLTSVPRAMLKLMTARILDTTASTNQPFTDLDILPMQEFKRQISPVNPPPSGRPSAVTIWRVEGVREQAIDPRVGATGIRVVSTVAENASLRVGVQYYNDADRLDVRKVQTTVAITATAASMISGTHYGIKAIGKSAPSTGIITIDNTAGTITFATVLPWERSPSFAVIAFNRLPSVSTDQFHCTYKEAPEYMTLDSDTMSPLPPEAVEVIMARVKARAMLEAEDPDWVKVAAEAKALENELMAVYHPESIEEPHMVLV